MLVMPSVSNISSLYSDFGLLDQVTKLEKEQNFSELRLLEETVSQFILLKSLEELREDQRKELDGLHIIKAQDMFGFFQKNIPNYRERLTEYGREFRNSIKN